MKKWTAMALCLLAFSCADEGTQDTDTIEFPGGPADSMDAYRVRADGVTVWADPVAINDVRIDRWILSGRTSYSIGQISATVAGEDVQTTAVSSRKFEVLLSAQQLAKVLTGEPVLVTIDTTSGKRFTVNFGLIARFRNTSGSSRLYPWQNIVPVVQNRQTVLRGRVTTRGQFDWLQGSNDDDSEPNPWQEDATHWVLDFPMYAIPWAASPTEDALYINGELDGKRYGKSAEIHMELSRLGVTTADPNVAWPAPSCKNDVQRCIDSLGADANLESCGSAREVNACEVAPDPQADVLPWKKRFADDLRAAIIKYYAAHEAEIVGSGGNTRPQALLAVDTDLIQEVLDPEEDPEAHDFGQVRVFSHPDMTFPGSDIVWFGAYDRATGALVGSVYDFN